tara:strand:- start:36 stop:605 length:570 start_codon:yes stop_codon:yes gene_type:complete
MNKKVNLKPFIRKNLDILFIALNPPEESNKKGHYFSVKQSLWNQLYKSGLISEIVDKEIADEQVFGSNKLNYNNWQYGIIDLVPDIVKTDGAKVKPTDDHVKKLIENICYYKPKIALIIEYKVRDKIYKKGIPMDTGYIGRILEEDYECKTEFFLIPFPHGDSVKHDIKIDLYKKVKQFIKKKNEKNEY